MPLVNLIPMADVQLLGRRMNYFVTLHMIVDFLLDEVEVLSHIIWKLQYDKRLKSRNQPTEQVFQKDRQPPILTNKSKSVLRYFLPKRSDSS